MSDWPDGFCPQGWKNSTFAPASAAATDVGDDRALGVVGHRERRDPGHLQEVEQRREAGLLDRDPVAVAQVRGDELAVRVHRSVDDGQLLDRERPRLHQERPERGDDRVLEVGVRLLVAGHAAYGGVEVGEQVRVGQARGQVDPEALVGVERPPVAARTDHGLADPGAAATVGLDQPGPRQLRPGRADRGRRDAEVAGRLPDRRQPVTRREHPAVDAGRERHGDALGRAVVDGRGQICPHDSVL